MAISVDPKIDFAFRYLMTIEGNKPVLRHFLNAALLRPPSEALVDITVGNPYNGRLGAKEKETILDLKATDSTGHQYQVEMQLVVTPSLPERMLYTWAHTFVRQIQAGQDERALRPLISIWLVNDVLPVESLLPPLTEEPPQEGPRQQKWSLSLQEGAKRDYYHRYVLVDPERRTLLSEYLTIIVIELQRPIDKSKELTPLDRWVLFFQEATMWDVDKLPYYMKTPEIIQAVQSLDELSRREEDYDLYRRRFLWLMHEQHIRRDMLHDVSEKLKQAEQEKLLAEQQRQQAEQQRQQAEQERLLAEQQRQQAELKQQQAEQQRQQAEQKQQQAEQQRQQAEQQRQQAEQQRQQAEQQRQQAEQEKLLAEHKQQQAEQERQHMQKEKQQAERLLGLQEDRLASLERQLQQLLASHPG